MRQRKHRASKPDSNPSAAALRLSSYRKADRLVGCNELSRGANAIISTCRAENDAAYAAESLAAKHPVSGGLTEDVAAAIDIALTWAPSNVAFRRSNALSRGRERSEK